MLARQVPLHGIGHVLLDALLEVFQFCFCQTVLGDTLASFVEFALIVEQFPALFLQDAVFVGLASYSSQ